MKDIIDDIYKGYMLDQVNSPSRAYLGASSVGHALTCKRRAYLAFRKACHETFDGRMLKLFDTGHREEARLIRDMRTAGYEIYGAGGDGTTKNQIKLTGFGGLFRGHPDGLIRKDGGPWMLLEIKTSSKARFGDFSPKKKTPDVVPKLRDVRPVHWAQVQVCMGLLQSQWPDELDGAPPTQALYIVSCKDNEHLHTEIVDFDAAAFAELGDIVLELLTAAAPPDKPFKTPDYKACTYCPANAICWDEAGPVRACGTCKHMSVNLADGTFDCGLLGAWGVHHTKPGLLCDKFEVHESYAAPQESFWS